VGDTVPRGRGFGNGRAARQGFVTTTSADGTTEYREGSF
jgi:hypothetical protein